MANPPGAMAGVNKSTSDFETRPGGALRADVIQAARVLDAWGRSRSWRGTDPYDALNSQALAWVLGRTPAGRRIVTQVVKRCPVDLRGVLGVPPGVSAAALAWVAAAYALDHGVVSDRPASDLDDVLNGLLALRCPAFPEPCWGYHFDVQTRVFFYPRSAPNTIATAFAGHAFLSAYERTGEKRWLDVACGVADFFLRHVPTTETADGIFFGYLVGDRTPIHNASLLVCSLLARLARPLDSPELSDRAAAGVAYALAHQHPDGSWRYGEEPHLAWIDNFHTGYVLDSLMICRSAGVGGGLIDDGLMRGLNFYAQHLFQPDGTPRYYPSSLYPIDIQCVTQGIQTFAIAARLDPRYAGLAWRVADFALRRMRRQDGAFIFQRRRFWKNPAVHVRWCEAPMLLALVHLLGTAQT